jgi:hypothetical protein
MRYEKVIFKNAINYAFDKIVVWPLKSRVNLKSFAFSKNHLLPYDLKKKNSAFSNPKFFLSKREKKKSQVLKNAILKQLILYDFV